MVQTLGTANERCQLCLGSCMDAALPPALLKPRQLLSSEPLPKTMCVKALFPRCINIPRILLKNSPQLVRKPWTAECMQAQGKDTFKTRREHPCADLPWGTVRFFFPLSGEYGKVLGCEQSYEVFSHIPSAPCHTITAPFLPAIKHPQPEAPFPRRRGWKDPQTSPPDLLSTDIQPLTSLD